MTLVNTYLKKSLPHTNPNLTILGKTCILFNFFPLCWQFLPIMLTLCSMLLPSYYAQNYAGIIGSRLKSLTGFTKLGNWTLLSEQPQQNIQHNVSIYVASVLLNT